MEAAEDERAAEAQREKEAGNTAYRKLFLETAVIHYTRGASLDPRDISFLTNRAAAYLLMGKYKECVRDCDEAVERGRELRADNKLDARALSRKASALLKLAGCARDYAPAIRALQQSLAEHYSEETCAKLDEAESARKELEEQERLDPPPPYGFHNLDRRTMILANGTVRSYFALPPDYPFEPTPLPPLPHLPRAGPDVWPPHQPPLAPHDAKRKHPADPDEGFPGHPKQPRFESPHHPSQVLPHAAVDRHALRRAFLKYAKMLNDSAAQRQRYLECGRVPCLACGRMSILKLTIWQQSTLDIL